MSLTDDHALQNNNREPHEHSHRVFDHTAEIISRSGLTREAANHEMEKFLGVAEYETRKIAGQHSTLRQPDAPAQNDPKRQKRAESRDETTKVESRVAAPTTEAPAQDVPADIQPVTPDQPEVTES